MLKLLGVDCDKIILSGITFNAGFLFTNSHEILAVMFEIEPKPGYFEVEPERGMVLQGEKKFIKIRLKPNLRGRAAQIQKQKCFAIIRATYYCEYNRKLLQKNRLSGWERISNQYEEVAFPVILNFEHQINKIRAHTKTNSSLKDSGHSRKQNSFQKFRDSSIKRVKDPKLNEDLDFIFRNEDYGKFIRSQQISKALSQNSRKPSGSGLSGISKFSNQPRKQVDLFRSVDSVYKKIEMEEQSQQYVEKKVKNKRTEAARKSKSFELIILAVLAALCLAVGELMGSIFR